jgi:hypothetical protein
MRLHSDFQIFDISRLTRFSALLRGALMVLGSGVTYKMGWVTASKFLSIVSPYHSILLSKPSPFSFFTPYTERSMSQAEGSESDSVIQTEGRENDSGSQCPPGSEAPAQSSFAEARQKRKIAELEGKVLALESGRVVKERYVPSFCVH